MSQCDLHKTKTNIAGVVARDANGNYRLDEHGWYAQPNDESLYCFAYLSASNQTTPSPLDDMHEECIGGGYNLEFKIQGRYGEPAPPSFGATATCISANTLDDCPGLD